MKIVKKSVVSAFMAMLWTNPALALSVKSLPEVDTANAVEAQFFGVCTGDGVSVRDLPDKSGNKIGFLYQDQAVYPLGKKRYQ